MASAGRFWSHRIAENGSAGAQLIGWAEPVVLVVGSSTGGQVVVDLVAHSCSFSRTRGARIKLQQTKKLTLVEIQTRCCDVHCIRQKQHSIVYSLYTKVSFIHVMHLSVCENHMKVIQQIMCLKCICVFICLVIISFFSLRWHFFTQFNLIDVGNVPVLLNSLKEYIYPY